MLCTCARAQTQNEERSSTVSSSARSVQSETDDGTHYSYSLRTNKVEREDILQAFAEAAGTTVSPRFTGDWTTSDDNGIKYSMNTRRNYLSIEYTGDDPEASKIAREKVRQIKRRLDIETDEPN